MENTSLPEVAQQQQKEPKARITTGEVKNYALLGLIGAGVVGGAFLGIRYMILGSKEKKTANDALNPNSAASYASRLKMAFENDNFFGWGTDEELVYTVFRELPSKAFYNDVIKAYSNLYRGANLNLDLKDELSSSEYQKVMDILNSKG